MPHEGLDHREHRGLGHSDLTELLQQRFTGLLQAGCAGLLGTGHRRTTGQTPAQRLHGSHRPQLAEGAGRSLPQAVVVVQCGGSRVPCHGVPYCSRVCCAATLQAANELRRRYPESAVYDLYRDIRTYGEREALYKKARKGEIKDFTGIDAPFEAPQNPDIEIKTARQSVEQSVNELLEKILPFIKKK